VNFINKTVQDHVHDHDHVHVHDCGHVYDVEKNRIALLAKMIKS